jgi:hypothetical protein
VGEQRDYQRGLAEISGAADAMVDDWDTRPGMTTGEKVREWKELADAAGLDLLGKQTEFLAAFPQFLAAAGPAGPQFTEGLDDLANAKFSTATGEKSMPEWAVENPGTSLGLAFVLDVAEDGSISINQKAMKNMLAYSKVAQDNWLLKHMEQSGLPQEQQPAWGEELAGYAGHQPKNIPLETTPDGKTYGVPAPGLRHGLGLQSPTRGSFYGQTDVPMPPHTAEELSRAFWSEQLRGTQGLRHLPPGNNPHLLGNLPQKREAMTAHGPPFGAHVPAVTETDRAGHARQNIEAYQSQFRRPLKGQKDELREAMLKMLQQRQQGR